MFTRHTYYVHFLLYICVAEHSLSVVLLKLCYYGIQEILDQVYVVNLDSGNTVPLSQAEEKLPKCINPLSLHIMRRTKEYARSAKLMIEKKWISGYL